MRQGPCPVGIKELGPEAYISKPGDPSEKLGPVFDRQGRLLAEDDRETEVGKYLRSVGQK
jgi:hypothetical protein